MNTSKAAAYTGRPHEVLPPRSVSWCPAERSKNRDQHNPTGLRARKGLHICF